MNSLWRWPVTVAVIACASVPASALATNGYFAHGWGAKSKAMAGVATALPQDTLVSATNPAGMAFVGDALDVTLAFFNPSPRGYKANNDYAVDPGSGYPTGPFVTPGDYESKGDWFLIPSFGFNYQLDERSTIGVSVFGNGGMNTEYRDRPVWENFAPPPDQLDANGNNLNPGGVLTATTPTGVNLEQLFIQIPYTLKLGDGRQAVGIAPVLAVQSFEAKGLQPFRAASVNPDKVTNNGKEWSYGAGLQVGWYGEVNDQWSLGLSYRSKVWMSDFDDYAGLFADGGSFDIPAMLNLGVAYQPRPELILAFDYQHLFYDEISAVANSNDKDLTPCFTNNPKPAYCLGGKDGLGFGWESVDVFKLGASYDVNEKLTLLGGVSYNTEFSSGRQALFNVLTPATIRWHLTLGAAYQATDRDELALSFAYMPEEELSGTSPSITQTQTGSIYMEQMEIQIGWSHRF